MSILNRIYTFFELHHRWSWFVVAFFTLGYFTWLQATPNFGDPDAFYHIVMAKKMAQTLIVQDFPYLQLNFLQHTFVDQHFLYHLLLMPFVRFFPDWIGAKIVQVILGTVLITSFYLVLKNYRVKGATWFALLLLLSESFIYRLNLIKAQPIALFIVILAILALTKHKHWWLLPLSWAYVWTHSSWGMIAILAITYIVVETFFNNQETAYSGSKIQRLFNRSHAQVMANIIVGLTLGLVLNPYFPHNLKFYWVQVVEIGLLNFQQVVHVGAEWYPYDIFSLVKNSLLPFTVIMFSGVVFGFYRKRMDVTTTFLAALTMLYFLLTLKARRNIEYFIPIGVLFSALVYTRAVMIDEFQQIVRRIRTFRYTSWLVVSSIIIGTVFSVIHATDYVHHGYPHGYGAKAGEFLRTHAQPGQTVFNVSWDMFPLMLYHASQQRYIVGLDPMFTYIENKEIYLKWLALSSGTSADISDIKKVFQASYVWVDQPKIYERQRLIDRLNQSNLMTVIYQDNQALIYRVE